MTWKDIIRKDLEVGDILNIKSVKGDSKNRFEGRYEVKSIDSSNAFSDSSNIVKGLLRTYYRDHVVYVKSKDDGETYYIYSPASEEDRIYINERFNSFNDYDEMTEIEQMEHSIP